jgi:hypothetical protein
MDASRTTDDLDKAMGAWFRYGAPTQKHFTETDIRGISEVLRRYEKHSWSRITRIYVTLRCIDKVEAISEFEKAGITDMAFPFSQGTLPVAFKGLSARADFLEAQIKVLSKGLDLEREHGRHRHFANPMDVPLEKLEELGKGVSGYVDRVRSTVSYREYARKLIPRGRQFRHDKAILRDFENELDIMKRLSHKHIVEIIGSYTDPK